MAMRWMFLIGLLALLPAALPAANHEVVVDSNSFSPANLTINAGDTVTFRNQGGLHNAASDPGSPNNFRCANGCDGSGGNGNPSGAAWTAVVTFNNPGLTRYYCEVHGGPGGEGMSGSITVEGVASVAPVARDDRVELRMNAPPVDVAVLANDIFDASALAGGSLVITQAPGVGSAAILDNGTPGDASDDRLRYTLPPDAAIQVDVGYRLCDDAARCDDGQVKFTSRALTSNDLHVQATSDAGFVDVALDNLPQLPLASYPSTPLVAPTLAQHLVEPDATPGTPWDNARAGTAFTTGTIPAPGDGLPQEWGVTAHARPIASGNIDLFVGIDQDLDGQPEASELRCTSAMSTVAESCDLGISHPGSGDVRYWILVQNIGAATLAARIESAQLRLQPPGDVFGITGPGHVPEGTPFDVRLHFRDPSLLPGEARLGFAVLKPVPEVPFGWAPVRIDHVGGAPSAVALSSGVDHVLRLAAGGVHERLYIDVPAGASSLAATSTSTANIDLYLAKDTSGSSPGIDPAPARGSAAASGTGPTGDESLLLQGAALTPGRWYVTPVSLAPAGTAEVTVRATVAGIAPVVRPGSYYNAARSGHGLFVYPAGSQLAIIWYTYFEDGTPTWYYLQGAQPGANGIWQGPVYRSAWDGDSNALQVVGHATLAPSGADAFTWSYTVDGRSGSEPFAALGRGCPTSGGGTRDASSHWFDPASAGSGYSVQMFPNYEFYAAFVYDGLGVPRFLVAELPGVGADSQVLDLEQLTGFCPTCARTGAPTRVDIGTFTRTFAAGELVGIQVDAIYTGAVPGAWTGNDAVQPLGGAGTLQGCDP